MKQTFTAKEVCAALAVPRGTLNSWAYHGVFKELDAPSVTAGKSRSFTRRDVHTLAIFKSLIGLGFSAKSALKYSASAVAHYPLCPMPLRLALGIEITISPTEIIHALPDALNDR